MNREHPIKSLIAATSGNALPEIDWDALLVAANNTLTTGTLAHSLLSNQDRNPFPEDVGQFLSAVYDRTVRRNRQMQQQLGEAVECLNKAGVSPVVFKGAAILHSAKRLNLHCRILTDLDLMVPDQALPEILAALEGIGYHCVQADAWSKQVPYILSRQTDAGTIDLHHHAYGNHPALGYEAMIKDADLVEIGSGTAWLPSLAMQIAILVVHDQLRDRDYWRGSIDLRHLLDSAALARSMEHADWRALDAIFPAGYPKRALRTHLLTLRSLLHTEVPPHLLSGLRPRIQLRRRMLQMRAPALQFPATVASLLIDPPTHSLVRASRAIIKNANKFDFYKSVLRSIRSGSRIARGFFRSGGLGKY